jgi:hypothetical protein
LLLEASGERGLSRTRTTIQDDDLHMHPSDSTAAQVLALALVSASDRAIGGTTPLFQPVLARVPARIGTGSQVVGTLSRLLLDEDHHGFGKNPIVLHGIRGCL